MNTEKITKRKFLADVRKEVLLLKKHATESQLQKLNFYYLDYNDVNNCIYGQMTGHCRSEDAQFLIEKCCTRYIHNELSIRKVEFNEFQDSINGTEAPIGYAMLYISSLEMYIGMKGSKPENVIRFLKGKVQKLSL